MRFPVTHSILLLALSATSAWPDEAYVYRHVNPGASAGPSGAVPPNTEGNSGSGVPPAVPAKPDTATLELASASVREGAEVSGRFASSIAGATWSKDEGPEWLTVSADGTVSGTSGDIAAVQSFTVAATASLGDRKASASGSLSVTPHTVTLSGVPQSLATGMVMGGNASASMGGDVTWSLTGTPPAWLTVSPAGILQGTAVQPYGSFAFAVRSTRGAVTATSPTVALLVTPTGNLASNKRPSSIIPGNPSDSRFAPSNKASDTVSAAYDRNTANGIMTYNMSSNASGKYMRSDYLNVYANGCYFSAYVSANAYVSLVANFFMQDGTVVKHSWYTKADANGFVITEGDCGIAKGGYVNDVNWSAENYTSTIRYTEARLTYQGISAP